MRFFKKVGVAATGLALSATSALAAIDPEGITLDASDIETLAPKILMFVAAIVGIGVVVKLIRRAG